VYPAASPPIETVDAAENHRRQRVRWLRRCSHRAVHRSVRPSQWWRQDKRLSCRRGTARRSRQLISCELRHYSTKKMWSEKAWKKWMILNVTQGQRKYATYYFLLMVCSKTSVLYRFRHISHITTVTVYVTISICDLKKSFSFDISVKIICRVSFLSPV